ncbi:MAG TPA: GAF domain-containing protein [Thermoanaerobaculia bacterium]|jgi:signal transduction histidine kinase/CheY-like chemotaxis protein|nr:GAF domain-containing protein [Thermoanaerobaculia bacterium]
MNILLVDDRDDFRQSFGSWLRDSLGHVVREAKSFDEALQAFDADPRFDIAIVDYSLDPEGPGTGIDLLGELKKKSSDLPVIVITGYGNRPIAQKSLRAGALWYLDKPPDLVEIDVLLDQARDRSLQRVLAAISEAIATAPDVASLIAAISQKAADFLRAASCDLLVIDPETGAPRSLPAWAHSAPEAKDHLLAAVQRAITNGEPSVASLALQAGESMAAKTCLVCPCPPQPKPSAVIVAHFPADLEPGDVARIGQSAVELGKIVGAKLANLYPLQLQEVRSLGLRLLGASSADEMYSEIVATATSVDLSSLSLCLYESSTSCLSFPIALEKSERLTVEPLPLAEAGEQVYEYISEFVIKTGNPMELPDHKSLQETGIRLCPIGQTTVLSYFEVPIRVDPRQQAFGALAIRKAHEGRFPDSSQRLLEAIANISAPALARFRERAALDLRITEMLKEQEALERRSKAEGDALDAASRQSRHELARFLEQTALGVWPHGRVQLQVLLYDRRTRGYQCLDGSSAEVHPAEDPFLGLERRDAGAQSVDGMSPAPASRGERALRVAIRVGDSRLGILLCTAEEPILLSRDLDFLERLARMLAGTLMAAARERRVELIREVATRAAADPSNALSIVTQTTHRIATGAGGEPTETTIFLLTGTMLEPVSAFPPERLPDVRQRIGSLSVIGKARGVVARAAIKKETQFIPDVRQDPDYLPLDPGTQAELAVPVFGFNGEVVGVLNLEFRNPGSLDQDDRALVEALAEQTAVINVLQSQALTLTKTEQMRTIAGTMAILGIEATETGHSLIGLLSSWRGYVVSCQEYLSRAHGPQKGALALLRRYLLHPREVNRSLLQLAESLQELKIGLEEDHFRGSTESVLNRSDIQVLKSMTRVVHIWRERQRGYEQDSRPFEIEIVSEITSSITVSVNEYWLSRSVNNLIKNSIRAVQELPDPPRKITLCLRCGQDRTIRIEVHDNGSGIPENVAKHLFTEPIANHLVHRGGHGTGCLLSSFIIQLYGGRIFLLREAKKGAHVAIELPMAKQINPLLF